MAAPADGLAAASGCSSRSGTVIAGFLANVVDTVRFGFEDGFRGPEDAGRVLGHDGAVMIPDLTARMKSVATPWTRPVDYLVTHPQSPFAAALARLGAVLRLNGAGAPRCLAVCSAVPGEGKSTLAACLALWAALSGLRVILVDCDGRKQGLSRLFTDGRSAGLVQFMNGSATLEDASIHDEASGAWIMQHSSTAEMVSLVAVDDSTRLIDGLTPHFDLVILDTGPVLALAETRVIAGCCDAVLLVARWRKTPAKATEMSLKLLVRAGAKVGAVALTMASSR